MTLNTVKSRSKMFWANPLIDVVNLDCNVECIQTATKDPIYTFFTILLWDINKVSILGSRILVAIQIPFHLLINHIKWICSFTSSLLVHHTERFLKRDVEHVEIRGKRLDETLVVTSD